MLLVLLLALTVVKPANTDEMPVRPPELIQESSQVLGFCETAIVVKEVYRRPNGAYFYWAEFRDAARDNLFIVIEDNGKKIMITIKTKHGIQRFFDYESLSTTFSSPCDIIDPLNAKSGPTL